MGPKSIWIFFDICSFLENVFQQSVIGFNVFAKIAPFLRRLFLQIVFSGQKNVVTKCQICVSFQLEIYRYCFLIAQLFR